jgi:hypothetical protein
MRSDDTDADELNGLEWETISKEPCTQAKLALLRTRAALCKSRAAVLFISEIDSQVLEAGRLAAVHVVTSYFSNFGG